MLRTRKTVARSPLAMKERVFKEERGEGREEREYCLKEERGEWREEREMSFFVFVALGLLVSVV